MHLSVGKFSVLLTSLGSHQANNNERLTPKILGGPQRTTS